MTIWTIEAAVKLIKAKKDPVMSLDSLLGLKNPSVVVALDMSGSTRMDQVFSRYAKIAESIEGAKVFTCAFNTECREINTADGAPAPCGGTDFSAVEDYIQKVVVPKNGSYPTRVLVITDGGARFHGSSPDAENVSRWVFLLHDHYDISNPLDGATIKILREVAVA